MGGKKDPFRQVLIFEKRSTKWTQIDKVPNRCLINEKVDSNRWKVSEKCL